MNAAPYVLITRPEQDAQDMAGEIRARGYIPLLAPLLSITYLDTPVPGISPDQTLIFTSANGVRAFAQKSFARDIPAYVVGPQTETAAQKAGFTDIRTGPGNAVDIAQTIRTREKNTNRKFLHIRGADIARSMKDLLPGYAVEDCVLYKAEPVRELPADILEQLKAGSIAAVLFFSGRTAQTFTRLIQQENCTSFVELTKALCLSDSVIECLSVLPWKGTYAAERPDREGMLSLLDQVVPKAIEVEQTMKDTDVMNNAAEIIQSFGGIRPMAQKLGIPVTTVQGWKKRDVIPGNRRTEIINAAQEQGITLPDTENVPANTNTHINTEQQEEAPITAKEPAFTVEEQEEENPASRIYAQQPVQRPEHDAQKTHIHSHTHEELMAAIQAGDQAAVRTSTWIAAGLSVLVISAGIILLWPSTQKAGRNDEKIAALNGQVAGLEGQINTLGEDIRDANMRGTFLKKIVPEEMQEKFDQLQNQARNLQTTVDQISERTQTIKSGVLGSDAGPISDRIALLEQEFSSLSGREDMQTLSTRIRNLEQSLAGQDQLKTAISELNTIVDSLDGKVSTLDQKLVAAQENSDGALGQTLEGVSGDDLKAAAMLIAFSQLRDSLNRQAPFEEDLALLQKMAGEDNTELRDALDRLAPKAQEGVLSPTGLSDEFKALAGEIVVSSLKGEDISIREKAAARFSEIFKVEKDGELVTGTDTQATVAKAQALLDQGNIQGAIAELQTLDGNAAQTAQPFIQQAEATLLAQKVQTLLHENILSKIGDGFAGESIGLPGGGQRGLPQKQEFKGFSSGQQ